jgi:hypothetical protein
MKTIEEVKKQIEGSKCVGDLPKLYFVGRIGEKTHFGTVFLTIRDDKLALCCASVGCGSKRWGGRDPSPSNLVGQVEVTCKRCVSGVKDLDRLNAEYKDILPLIGGVLPSEAPVKTPAKKKAWKPVCDEHGRIIPSSPDQSTVKIVDTERRDLDYTLRLSPDIMDVVDATKDGLSRDERISEMLRDYVERCL